MTDATGANAVRLSLTARCSVSNAHGAHPIRLSSVSLAKRNDNLGMPPYVTDLWWNYGWSEARRRVTVQLAGADTTSAFNYYTAVVAAMDAVQNGAIPPAVPPALAPATDMRLRALPMEAFPLQAAGTMH